VIIAVVRAIGGYITMVHAIWFHIAVAHTIGVVHIGIAHVAVLISADRQPQSMGVISNWSN
jgi:hypothetical protein